MQTDLSFCQVIAISSDDRRLLTREGTWHQVQEYPAKVTYTLSILCIYRCVNTCSLSLGNIDQIQRVAMEVKPPLS